MKLLTRDLIDLAIRVEDYDKWQDLTYQLSQEVSYQEIMIQALMGTPTAAYLSESNYDAKTVRDLILAGVEIGKSLTAEERVR